jgi:hypothetical protein
MAGMGPAAVIPSYDSPKGHRRPSNLTVSSRSIQSPEPSPTRSRNIDEEMGRGVAAAQEHAGPFIFAGPEKKRFHADRELAPYPLPCGVEELSRSNHVRSPLTAG